MDDGDIKKTTDTGFLKEWRMFWKGIIGDEAPVETPMEDPFETGKLEVLSPEQVKALIKAMSSDRRSINQKIEKLRKAVEEATEKIETLKLVGGDTEEALQEIEKYSDQGAKLSGQLEKLNEKLKVARAREDQIKSQKELR